MMSWDGGGGSGGGFGLLFLCCGGVVGAVRGGERWRREKLNLVVSPLGIKYLMWGKLFPFGAAYSHMYQILQMS